jgi:pentatricopeptide repeat protein
VVNGEHDLCLDSEDEDNNTSASMLDGGIRMLGLDSVVGATAVYGAMLRGCCVTGNMKQAAQVVEKMRERGVWDSAKAAIAHSTDTELLELLAPYLNGCEE